MSDNSKREPMLDMFIFETRQLIGQLEQEILTCEKSGSLDLSINEIFRVMHTIKSSAAMMLFNNIATLAHSIEDLFFFIRDNKPLKVNDSEIIDIVFEGTDFIKNEITKIDNGLQPDGCPDEIIEKSKSFLNALGNINIKPSTIAAAGEHSSAICGIDAQFSSDSINGSNTKDYNAIVFFEDGSEMENVRAFALLNNLKQAANIFYTYPLDIIENNRSADIIKKEGFIIKFRTNRSLDELKDIFERTIFFKKR